MLLNGLRGRPRRSFFCFHRLRLSTPQHSECKQAFLTRSAAKSFTSSQAVFGESGNAWLCFATCRSVQSPPSCASFSQSQAQASKHSTVPQTSSAKAPPPRLLFPEPGTRAIQLTVQYLHHSIVTKEVFKSYSKGGAASVFVASLIACRPCRASAATTYTTCLVAPSLVLAGICQASNTVQYILFLSKPTAL